MYFGTFVACIFLNFNSIKVQLKLESVLNTFRKKLFQFHKGTIKTVRLINPLSLVLHFNSIKVQLKLDKLCTFANAIRFQFHKGTIKTCSLRRRFLVYHPFQFHKGTIKTEHRHATATKRGNFNSIKVQLKLLLLACAVTWMFISIP